MLGVKMNCRALLLGLLLLCGCATAQDEISFKATEVAPGLFMLEGVGGFTGGNLGVLRGKDGTILIDNGVMPLADKTLAAVGKAAGGEVDFVVNTHAHGDHIGANNLFSQRGATIISHDKLRQRLVENGITGPDGRIEATPSWLPEITFESSLSLHLNGQHVHVFHVANAHTDGDAVVYFRDANVIHAGDIFFNGLFPFIDLDSGGSVDGYLDAQHKILLLAGDNTQIIPGHGPLANKDDLDAAHEMLADSRDRIRALVAAGKSDDEIVTMNPLADYDADWTWGFITTERMTRQLIRDARN